MPELRASLPLSALRGSVTAGVAMLLAVWAHTAAGGLLPAAPWLLLIAVALAAVTAGMLTRPASRRRLIALVAGGQFAVHTLLTAAAGHRGNRPGLRHVSSAGADPAALSAGDLSTGADRSGSFYDLTMTPGVGGRPVDASNTMELPHWVTHILADLAGPHALMAVAHLVAAAGVACWLAVGETALWTLIVLVGATAAALARRLVAITQLLLHGSVLRTRPSVAPVRRAPCVVPQYLAAAVSRRGPPVAA